MFIACMNLSYRPMKTNRPDFKNIYFPLLVCCIVPVVLWHASASAAPAVDEPYSIISKKNLFNPDRKEWIMEKSDGKAGDAKKAVPKIDLKQIRLLGTIIAGNEKKALIKNNLKKGSEKRADLYMAGDYIEGYLLKEINEKKVLLANTESNDSVELFLHEGSAQQRSSEKTDVTMPAPPAEEKKIFRQKAETTKDLTERMKQSQRMLKNRESENVRQQVERDFKKMQEHFSDLSEQEQQEVILLKKEIDRTKNEKK